MLTLREYKISTMQLAKAVNTCCGTLAHMGKPQMQYFVLHDLYILGSIAAHSFCHLAFRQ